MKCYLGKKQLINITFQTGRVIVYANSFRPVSWFSMWTIALSAKFQIKLTLSLILHFSYIHAVCIVSANSFKAMVLSAPERAQICIGSGNMFALVVLLWQHWFGRAPGAVARWWGWFSGKMMRMLLSLGLERRGGENDSNKLCVMQICYHLYNYTLLFVLSLRLWSG